MFKILRDRLDWINITTEEHDEWHSKLLECIDLIEAGETTINGKRAEAELVWSFVNFINAWNMESEDESKYELQERINMIFMLTSRMSDLTYREVIELFPVRIRYEDGGEKYFGVNDIPNCTDDYGSFDSIMESFGSIGLITLCGSGIHFGDETAGTTDFDSKIGDGLMRYVSNCHHPVLGLFYGTIICTVRDISYHY